MLRETQARPLSRCEPLKRAKENKMSHTYTNLLFHIVFSTKERYPFLKNVSQPRIYEYIGVTIRGLGGTCIEIGGVSDHVHILVKLKPTMNVSRFLQYLRPNVTKGHGGIFIRRLNGKTDMEHLPSAGRRLKTPEDIFEIRNSTI